MQGVNNVYILENGLNDWKKLFADKTVHEKPINIAAPPAEVINLFPKNTYIQKIKIASKKHAGGLCG